MSVHQGRQCDPGSLRTIAAISSALLLALSIYAAPAHAIELFQPPTNASLAFSPTSVSTNQFTNICAINYNKAAATVEFVFKDQTDPAQNFNSVAVIAPGTRDCAPRSSRREAPSRTTCWYRSCFSRRPSAARAPITRGN